MGYRVIIKKQAEKQLASIEPKTRRLIQTFIKDQLEGSTNPQALSGCKKLQGVQNGWRWRVGVYRLLGIVDGDTITIQLFRIGHRRDVYRRMN
ncbi:type II toxin-antitoxin system RelE/ParE family toxin [Adlercreutzia sp. ZJ304]|uniref:type II toxin-antitoxin system RelE family toxin n=1 Tax=Adlercreutzia sp. ZJ304 TaxID=2709791 RepID=UPI001F14D958|nr:type II toxin-antitoxin system RelE/ParE family toxin [Adlercreutzia sp. ZJ304]